jgi:hypothetical protein
MRPVASERGQSIVVMVHISKLGIKYWTRGILYKFSLLERPWHIQYSLDHGIADNTFQIKTCKNFKHRRDEIYKYIRRKVNKEDRLQIKGLKGT